jgi:protein tyrosine phosphatase (PTP) superfamily phosphohydrolase (DUF442 family)
MSPLRVDHGVRRLALALSAPVTLALLVGFIDPATTRTHAPDETSATAVPLAFPPVYGAKPIDLPGLHNLVAYHAGFVSGSVPKGDAGFDTLKSLGVKTVISVDGAAPDLTRVKARGMRYIHLPIGYNGFDRERQLQLVRATRDAMKAGPVYIHCHHGKHRSAGAAGVVAVCLDWATPEEMLDRMKVSGTSPAYKGLFARVRTAEPLMPGVIDAVPADFPEISRTTDTVKAMVEIDEATEHLKLIEKSLWRPTASHPDLVPAAEAGRLADILRVLAEAGVPKDKPAEYFDMMRENSERAKRLEDLLLSPKRDEQAMSAQFKLVVASCKECHVKYRD